MSVDIGNLCIECGKDTSVGSGLFVNRIPADNGELDGYLCPDCQMCEGCNAEPSEPCREWCLSREDNGEILVNCNECGGEYLQGSYLADNCSPCNDCVSKVAGDDR